jgi:hypothetical protein
MVFAPRLPQSSAPKLRSSLCCDNLIAANVAELRRKEHREKKTCHIGYTLLLLLVVCPTCGPVMSSTQSQLEVPSEIPVLTAVACIPSDTNDVYRYETDDCLDLHLDYTTSGSASLTPQRNRNEGTFMTSRLCPEGYSAECGHATSGESGTVVTCYSRLVFT